MHSTLQTCDRQPLLIGGFREQNATTYLLEY